MISGNSLAESGQGPIQGGAIASDEGTSHGALGGHRLAKGRHQEHLGQIGRIEQSALDAIEAGRLNASGGYKLQ